MLPYPAMPVRKLAEPVTVLLAAAALSVAMTWPLARDLSHAGRTDTSDGQWSIWVVNWVAHAIADPKARLYDTNIFYPHKGTLAFSEANIGAGLLGVPAHLASGGNPYTTHNAVTLIGFALGAAFAYVLVRHLTGHRGAAALAGAAFGFCPFTFARFAHIQLLLTFGIPLALLAMHRLIDRPGPWRAVALGAALVGAALLSGYYGIFAALSVSLGMLYYAVARRLWRSWRYWLWTLAAALVAVGGVLPFFLPYSRLEAQGAPFRSLEEAGGWSANGAAWLASAGAGHRWMHPFIGTWSEVLFPGFVVTALALGGLAAAVWGARGRRAALDRPHLEAAGYYGLVGVLAFWISFGPEAGLYPLLYRTIPVFSFLRAPGRFGILVALSLAVIAGVFLAAVLRGRRRGWIAAAALAVAVLAENTQAPINFRDAIPVAPAYRVLATVPKGPVAIFPFFYRRIDLHRHAHYMLLSTHHWQPIINGYSDYIPPDFTDRMVPISTFPTRESFEILKGYRIRYAVFHLNWYDRRSRPKLLERLEEYRDYLRPLNKDGDIWLFEVMGFPS